MDASFELLGAVFARLRATSAVTSYVGTRIYDKAPADSEGRVTVPFPYISNGPSTSIPDDYNCSDGEIVTIQLDVWSSGPGEAYSTAECRKICGGIQRALHGAELSLATNALVTLEWELTRIIEDRNPAIKHGVIQLSGTVELT